MAPKIDFESPDAGDVLIGADAIMLIAGLAACALPVRRALDDQPDGRAESGGLTPRCSSPSSQMPFASSRRARIEALSFLGRYCGRPTVSIRELSAMLFSVPARRSASAWKVFLLVSVPLA